MLTPPDEFEIKLNNVTMKMTELDLPGHLAFRVVFSSNRPPLVVAMAKNSNYARFWTSIPEGRQKEAEGIGKLIDDHYQKQNKS